MTVYGPPLDWLRYHPQVATMPTIIIIFLKHIRENVRKLICQNSSKTSDAPIRTEPALLQLCVSASVSFSL